MRRDTDARIIHQDVDAPERLLGGRGDALDIFLPADVALKERGFSADLLRRYLPCFVDVADDNRRAIAGQRQGDGFANTGAASSNPRDFPGQIHLHGGDL